MKQVYEGAYVREGKVGRNSGREERMSDRRDKRRKVEEGSRTR